MACISDDWQEIDDERTSVISLASDSTAHLDNAGLEQSLHSASDLSLVEQPSPHNSRPLSGSPPSEILSRDSESPADVLANVTPYQELPSHKEVATYTQWREAGSAVDEPLSTYDVDNSQDDSHAALLPPQPSDDPVSHHSALCLLISAIDALSKRLEQAKPSQISATELPVLVRSLRRQVGTLEPIVSACAKQWHGRDWGTAAIDTPLNKNLFEWVSTVQYLIEDVGSQLESPPNDSLKSLSDCVTTMEMFLPIFKVDFDEFHTRLLSFPIHPPHGDPESGPSTGGRNRSPPHPTAVRLRKELYNIKDHLKLLDELVRPLCLKPISKSNVIFRIPRAFATLTTLTLVQEALATILTNNGSEWIDSDTSSGEERVLSYSRFISLSPDMLHDVDAHLVRFYEDLNVDELDMTLVTTAIMRQNHQIAMLEAGGQLEELQSMLSFLEKLLC